MHHWIRIMASALAVSAGCGVAPAPGDPSDSWQLTDRILVSGCEPGACRLGGQCLSRTLVPDVSGNVACVVIEATHEDGGQTSCGTAPGHVPIPAAHTGALAIAKEVAAALSPASLWNDFCEVTQLPGVASDAASAKARCQTESDPTTPGLDGWCYVDAPSSPTQYGYGWACPPSDPSMIRFVGQSPGVSPMLYVITCTGTE